MTYIAIMSAIVIVISLVTSFIPLLGAIFSLIVPLIGTLVALYTKPQFGFLFIIVTVGLSLVSSLHAIENTVFFILPAVITGLIFGIIIKKGLDASIGILVSSIVQAIINIGIYYLFFLILKFDIIQLILQIFGLSDQPAIETILGLAILLFAMIQFLLSYLVILPQLSKFSNIKPNIRLTTLVHIWITLASSLLIIPFAFFLQIVSYILFGISIFSGTYLIFRIIRHKKIWHIAYICGLLFVSIIVFIGFVTTIGSEQYGLLFFAMVPFSSTLLFLLDRTILDNPIPNKANKENIDLEELQ